MTNVHHKDKKAINRFFVLIINMKEIDEKPNQFVASSDLWVITGIFE